MKNNKFIEAVIFDLSGTLVDFGSLATIQAMQKIFKSKGIILSKDIINLNMGIKKEKHIKKILSHPLIKFKLKNKRKLSKSDIKKMIKDFDKELIFKVKKNLNIIPNVKKIIDILKKNNIKIGITTGYPKKITKIIINYLKKNKIFFNSTVSDDEVKNGRPSPDMCKKNLINMQIINPRKCIKVDDSFSGIVEGKRSKMMTVGLISTGIQLGLSKKDLARIPKKKKNKLFQTVKNKFKKLKTDIVVNDHFEFENILIKRFLI